MTATSKAFRANVGVLLEHQATNLQTFARRTCAISSVFRSERGATVLVALRDYPRSSASHARSVRTWLKRIGIPVGLRGHWCTLLTDEEVIMLCAGTCRELPPVRERSAVAETAPCVDAVKTIHLY